MKSFFDLGPLHKKSKLEGINEILGEAFKVFDLAFGDKDALINWYSSNYNS